MSTPPKTPDEESDEDATMLKNLIKATDKYEAAIAIQPQAARLLNTHSNTYKNRHLKPQHIKLVVEISKMTKTATRATTSETKISTT